MKGLEKMMTLVMPNTYNVVYYIQGKGWLSMKYKDSIRGRDWATKGIVTSKSKLLLVISHLVSGSVPSWVKVS